MGDKRPEAGYLGDYQFLTQSFPGPTTVRAPWLLDDVALTAAMFLTGLYDLSSGIFSVGWPAWTLENIQGINNATITTEFTRLERVRGTGGVEAGIAALAVASYRVARWSNSVRFNGVMFQLIWFVNLVGKSLAFNFRMPPGGFDPVPPIFYMSIARVALSALCFLLSLYTYRTSWRWLFMKR